MNTMHRSARPPSKPHEPESLHGDEHQGAAQMDGMVEMARENERFHLAPAPGAVPPAPEPFPRPVIAGLVLGAVGGGLLGFGFARLLLAGTIAVPGWEQLYSMSPGTFSTFWVGIGVAVGVLLGGVGTILFVPPSPLEGEAEPSGKGPAANRADLARGQP